MTRALTILAALLSAGLLLGVLLSGCTSDLPNELGHDLGAITVDTVLAPLSVENVTQYSVLAVDDPETPFVRSQTLYLGEQTENASSILVNFNFGDVFSEDYPESLFTRDNIKTIVFSLTMLDFYGNKKYNDTTGDSLPASDIRYWLSELEAPFDTTATPPMPVPPNGVAFFQDQEGGRGKFPRLPVEEDRFLGWLADGDTLGILVEAGPGSDEELIGFASRELTLFGQIPPVAVGTVVGPNFAVEFQDGTFFLMPSIADISTFHQLEEPPTDLADGLMFRTGLRSYFSLLFDLSALPANAYINRAALRITADPALGFGTLTTLQAAELDSTLITVPITALTVDELADAVELTSALSAVDPYQNSLLEFNVTQYVQRRLNNVYTGRRSLSFTGDERAFGLNFGVAPDFYFNVMKFHGTAAADSLRPRMRITYTQVDEISGGAP